MKNARAHVVISGMVQGVCFRYEARMRAQSLGLTGWVMNRRDGDVEVVFEGPEDAVKSMVRWCSQGPSGAIVDNVDIKWEEYTGGFDGFGVRYSM